MCSGRSTVALAGGLACLLCIQLLLSVSTVGGGTNAASSATVSTVASSREHSHMVDRGWDPLYASKRRVPKGADPIHNRRAGKLGRPPVRA